MGLALRGSETGLEVVGFARRPEVRSRALELGVVDEVEASAALASREADVVIIAAPALAVRSVLGEIGGSLRQGALVSDTASTKAAVMGWAAELLPPSVTFIGGHPMAGRETSGIEAAEAELLHGCIYCLTPSEGANRESMSVMEQLIRWAGAEPFVIDAAEHDNLVAGVSHLPLLISVALVAATTRSPLWPAMARLAASGYRDVSRLASGDPLMSRDICLTNRQPIVEWIDNYIAELEELRSLMLEDDERLEAVFKEARRHRESWLKM